MVKTLFQILGFLVLMVPGLVMAQKTLSAGVDRTLVEIGDIIQLTVTANFQTTSDGPNFETLKPQFEVLGKQASSQLRVINGQFTGTTQWDAQILATQKGELTIPAFEVEGIVSKPIQIQVSEASQPQADYKISFLEAEVDTLQPYVQSQVIFTLRYYHLGQLIRGNIEPPSFNGALSERLRNQQSFERRVNGRIYRVYEWVYAIFPQTSGELVIPPQVFDGTLLHNRQLRLVEEKSETLRLQVRSIPQSYPKNAVWLPAKSLNLKQEWTQEVHLQVGDTIGRRIHLDAVGLKSSQLPSLEWPVHDDYRLYKDPAALNDHLAESGLSSSKVQDFMMVMQKPGEIEFKSIEIPWWNTQTDQLEWAKLDSHSYQIEPNPALVMDYQTEPHQHDTHSSNTGFNLWFWTTWLFVALWLISLILLFNKKRTRINFGAEPAKDDPSTDSGLAALFQNDDKQLYIELQQWLKNHYQITDWRQLKTRQPKLYDMIAELESALFSANSSNIQINRQALQHELNAMNTQQQTVQSHLTPLYPN